MGSNDGQHFDYIIEKYFRWLLPAHKEDYGLQNLTPGSELVKTIDMHGQESWVEKAMKGNQIAALISERKEKVALLSLKLKQDTVVWTLAEHFAQGTPAEADVTALKESYQEFLEKGFPDESQFDYEAFQELMTKRSEI